MTLWENGYQSYLVIMDASVLSLCVIRCSVGTMFILLCSFDLLFRHVVRFNQVDKILDEILENFGRSISKLFARYSSENESWTS